jgi:hypothetical protein
MPPKPKRSQGEKVETKPRRQEKEEDEEITEEEEEEEEEDGSDSEPDPIDDERLAKLQAIASQPNHPPPSLNVFLSSGLFELVFGLCTFIGITFFTFSLSPNASSKMAVDSMTGKFI